MAMRAGWFRRKRLNGCSSGNDGVLCVDSYPGSSASGPLPPARWMVRHDVAGQLFRDPRNHLSFQGNIADC
jgi:hypothetical protein